MMMIVIIFHLCWDTLRKRISREWLSTTGRVLNLFYLGCFGLVDGMHEKLKESIDSGFLLISWMMDESITHHREDRSVQIREPGGNAFRDKGTAERDGLNMIIYSHEHYIYLRVLQESMDTE